MPDPNIIEQRSWYSDGYVVVTRERGLPKGLWYQLPYRRFQVRWRGGWLTLPWHAVRRRD